MLLKAKEIAISNGKEKITILSDIKARTYYRKVGYKLYGLYMVKYFDL